MSDPVWRLDATGIWWLQLHEQVLAEVWREGDVWKADIKVGKEKIRTWNNSLSEMKKSAEIIVREELER